MSCCAHASAGGKFFSFFARRYRKKYLKNGLEKTQKQLLEGLTKSNFSKSTILDIGSGVGYLHQLLLKNGADTATGVDLSEKMLVEAQLLAKEQGLENRVVYLHGDFLNLVAEVETADISILDKVVCCYPDARTLVNDSLSKTSRVYALTYPRKTFVTRVGEKIMAGLMSLLRSDFRSYVHDPAQIEKWITNKGFSKSYENKTLLWLTQVYTK